MARTALYGTSRSTSRGYSYASNGSAAYQRQTAPARQPQRQPQRKPMRVIPGKGTSSERSRGLSLAKFRAFKMVLVFAVLFGAVCAGRVWMSVSTVQALQSSSNIQTQIEEARATGNDLEIEHSVLANPTRVQKRAQALGMSAPKSTEQIKVALPAGTKTFNNGLIDLKSTVKSIEASVSTAK